jgi:hypothetical protein
VGKQTSNDKQGAQSQPGLRHAAGERQHLMRLLLRNAILRVLFWLAMRSLGVAAMLMGLVRRLVEGGAADVAPADAGGDHARSGGDVPVVFERVEDRLFRTLH